MRFYQLTKLQNLVKKTIKQKNSPTLKKESFL